LIVDFELSDNSLANVENQSRLQRDRGRDRMKKLDHRYDIETPAMSEQSSVPDQKVVN
jgi:hypothetical protein